MRAALPVLAAAFMAGCAAGPDFQKPSPPSIDRYQTEALPEATVASAAEGVKAQRFVGSERLPAEWWKLFGSPALDSLVQKALVANPNVQAATAALLAAQENTSAQRGAFLPQLSGSFSSQRQKVADPLASPLANGGSVFTLHTVQVTVSYAPDVFGLNRRSVEGLLAQEESQRFQLEASYLTLTTNVVAAAIQEGSLQAQLEATRALVDIEAEQASLMRRQLELGAVPELNLVAQEAALAQAEAAVPALEKSLRQQRDALAVLSGSFPGEYASPPFQLSSLALPEELPVTLPSTLVDRRPDVRSAQAQLHAASAQVGVATANMLPQITLGADAGSTAEKLAKLFTGGGFWTATAGLTQPIFQGGTLLHRKRAAEAAYDQAAAQYRATVLAAFQNVADVLAALEEDARSAAATARAEHLAAQSLEITRRQLALGDVGYLAVLNAEQAYGQARIARVQAQANRLADTVALFQALGGGWKDR